MYINSFEMKDSKRGDKMWETRNSNTDSSEKTENSKSFVKLEKQEQGTSCGSGYKFSKRKVLKMYV